MSIRVKGITWLGIRTRKFSEMENFFGKLFNIPTVYQEPGFLAFDLPNGDRVELFAEDYVSHNHFTTGPVAGFEVEDVEVARVEMERAGVEFIGPIEIGEDSSWSHFRGPDGNVYELSSKKLK